MVKELPITEFVHFKYSVFERVAFFKDSTCQLNKRLYERMKTSFSQSSTKRCVCFHWQDFTKNYGQDTFKNNLIVFILGNGETKNIKTNPNKTEIDTLFCSLIPQITPGLHMIQKKCENNIGESNGTISAHLKQRKFKPQIHIKASNKTNLYSLRSSLSSGFSLTKRAVYLKNKMINNSKRPSMCNYYKCIACNDCSFSLIRKKKVKSYHEKSFKNTVRNLKF